MNLNKATDLTESAARNWYVSRNLFLNNGSEQGQHIHRFSDDAKRLKSLQITEPSTEVEFAVIEFQDACKAFKAEVDANPGELISNRDKYLPLLDRIAKAECFLAKLLGSPGYAQ